MQWRLKFGLDLRYYGSPLLKDHPRRWALTILGWVRVCANACWDGLEVDQNCTGLNSCFVEWFCFACLRILRLQNMIPVLNCSPQVASHNCITNQQYDKVLAKPRNPKKRLTSTHCPLFLLCFEKKLFIVYHENLYLSHQWSWRKEENYSSNQLLLTCRLPYWGETPDCRAPFSSSLPWKWPPYNYIHCNKDTNIPWT